MLIKTIFLILIFIGNIFIFQNSYASEISTPSPSYLNDLYFIAGGGKAEFQDSDFSENDNITLLRYGIGYNFPWFSTETAYRGYSNGEDFTIQGLDILAQKTLFEWSDFKISAGIGAYIYKSKLDNPIYDSQSSHNDISPLLSVGGYYRLNEYIDIGLNYDHTFNIEFTSPKYDRPTNDALKQFTLSLIVRPWGAKSDNVTTIEMEESNPNIITIFNEQYDSETYAYDSYQLTPSNRISLDNAIERTRSFEHYVIIVTGSADTHEKYRSYNEKLADKRARTAINYLQKNGIPSERIHLKTDLYLLSPEEKERPKARKVIVEIKNIE
ncbi:OmpA family protein [Vibrio sp.]|uniref:OmpA family protein n=1 Tax=Vibrio sp. TaxID=678 RepID=UPI003AA8F753